MTASSPVPVVSPAATRANADARTVKVRARRRRILVNIARVSVAVVFLGAWQLTTAVGILDPFFFGQPSAIVDQLVQWVQYGTDAGSLWEQIGITLEEAFLGFGIGLVLGVTCGVAFGRVRLLSEIFGPYIKIMNSIPRIVLGSIFLVWLGLGIPSKVALAVVLVFFAVFFNAYQGTREVDRNYMANARILGASRSQVTRQVVLPSAFTWIIASMHVSFGFALIGAIVGEFLGAQRGLGLLIQQAQGSFNPNGVFAAMVIIAAVALITEGFIGLLEKKLLAWRPPAVSAGAEL
ncbi:ABC transporter permease [Amycolatopsis sp. lyj-23]|uniref:ABC transporter permease n=1 Tax=Amycolatopsis sp. lyj-23 TaxID=2789283 RepID=UPI00397D48A2